VRGSHRPWAGTAVSFIGLAGIALGAAGCTSNSPVTPTPAKSTPPPPSAVAAPPLRQLSSAIVLQPVLGQPPTTAGACPAGYATASGPADGSDAGLCLRRQGTPLTVTAGTVSVQSPGPGAYGVSVIVPPADKADLTKVTTQAFQDRGYVDISVAGQSWAIPKAEAPLTGGIFMIPVSSRSQATQLQNLLTPSSCKGPGNSHLSADGRLDSIRTHIRSMSPTEQRAVA
jgi:hypothetical protein